MKLLLSQLRHISGVLDTRRATAPLAFSFATTSLSVEALMPARERVPPQRLRPRTGQSERHNLFLSSLPVSIVPDKIKI